MRHLEEEIRQIANGHGRHDVHHVQHRDGRIVHQSPTFRPVYAAHERDHHLTTSGRRALPARLYALPPGPSEIRRGIAGRVPFDSYGRAKSGLSRLSGMHHRGTISTRALADARRKILAYWPSIGSG